MKFCKTCLTDKEPFAFPKNKRLPDGLGYECKECAHARYRKWAESKSSYCKERNKDNYSKNRAEILEFKRKDRAENLAEYRARDSQNKKRNRASDRAKCGKRRASRTKATPRWLTHDHLTMMKITYAMSVELGKLYGRRFHIDHIHPLRGENICGLHVPWNLQVLPMEDNIAKHNRLKEAA